MAAATVALPDVGGFAGTRLSDVSRFENDQFYFKPENQP